MQAQRSCAEQGIPARVVSMPSHGAVRAAAARAIGTSVLPEGVPRVAIEAAHPMSWYKWVGSDGVVMGVDRFGAIAPYEQIYEELGLTVDKVVAAREGCCKTPQLFSTKSAWR